MCYNKRLHFGGHRISGVNTKVNVLAVQWLRQLVAGLLPLRPGFALASVHVGFVVDKVALGQVFLRVLRFPPVSIILPELSILIYHLGDEQ
jgi:hypothetical protein